MVVPKQVGETILAAVIRLTELTSLTREHLFLLFLWYKWLSHYLKWHSDFTDLKEELYLFVKVCLIKLFLL